MSLGSLSLAGLALAILGSLTLRLNAGLLALLLAAGAGALSGVPLREVGAAFPSQVLLTLVGLTLLSAIARDNGTLERLAGWAVQPCRGRVALVPLLFFALAALLGTIGAGNIGAVALLAPVGMAAAGELGVPPLLMAICIGTGGSAAALTPLGPTAVVARGLLERAGVPFAPWHSYGACLLAHAVVGLGGYRLLRRRAGDAERARLEALLRERRRPFRRAHLLTLAAAAALLIAVAFFRVDLGVAALLCAVVLLALRVADEEAALRGMPWGSILMVCGMMTLLGLIDRGGGTRLLIEALGRPGGPQATILLVGFLASLLSAYASSIGVALPAFLPLVPGLAERSGADPAALVSTILVSTHLVDVSPLSTLGGLCLASAPPTADRAVLYRRLLAWGMSMALVGAVYSYVVFGLLGPGRAMEF